MEKRIIAGILMFFTGITGVFFSFLALESENALFLIADGLDRPSYLYNIIIKRVYGLSLNKNFRDKIMTYLEDNKNENLKNLYIQVLGITGESSSAGVFIKEYSRYQHDRTHLSKANRIIDSMGLIANDELIPFLETLLRDYDRLRVQAPKYSIVRSLYLITGEKYSYIDKFGRKMELQATKELREARNVILKSKGRRRTVQEMLLLDAVYNAPSMNK